MSRTEKEEDLYFINEQINKLHSNYKKTRKLAWMQSIIIGGISIFVICLSLYLIYYLTNHYDNSDKKVSWFNAIGPQIMIMMLAIILFIFIIFMVIFRSIMHLSRYEQGIYKIEFISSQYLNKSGKYKSSNRLTIYKEEVTFIVNKTIFFSPYKSKWWF